MSKPFDLKSSTDFIYSSDFSKFTFKTFASAEKPELKTSFSSSVKVFIIASTEKFSYVAAGKLSAENIEDKVKPNIKKYDKSFIYHSRLLID